MAILICSFIGVIFLFVILPLVLLLGGNDKIESKDKYIPEFILESVNSSQEIQNKKFILDEERKEKITYLLEVNEFSRDKKIT